MMNYEDRCDKEAEISIAQAVMERIRKEDPWAFPQTTQAYYISVHAIRWLTALGILMLTLCLFFFLESISNQNDEEGVAKPGQVYKQVVGVGEIGYADSSATSLKSISVEDMVASIGEAFMLHSSNGDKTLNFPLIAAFFIFFEVLLLMNWLTRNAKP